MEGDGQLNDQIDDGEIGMEYGPLFDHEVSADRYNSLMDKLETLKENKDRVSN